MPYAVLCASHSPLALREELRNDAAERFSAAMARSAAWVREFGPDLVIQFAPDHYNGFFYDIMPAFCVGARARSVGDWSGLTGPMDVPEDLALRAVRTVRAHDLDIAVSFDMQVDHGFSQIWQMMFGDLKAYPVIPVMINCIADPMPSFRRARLLGEAFGEFARESGLKILFIGAGGLSHDPPVPSWAKADDQQKQFLLCGRNPGPEQRRAREERVTAAAIKYADTAQGVLAPDLEWDRKVLALLAAGDLAAFDQWTDQDVSAAGGCGGHEIRNWIAAYAAMKAVTSNYRMEVDYHEIVPLWLTGMAISRAK